LLIKEFQSCSGQQNNKVYTPDSFSRNNGWGRTNIKKALYLGKND